MCAGSSHPRTSGRRSRVCRRISLTVPPAGEVDGADTHARRNESRPNDQSRPVDRGVTSVDRRITISARSPVRPRVPRRRTRRKTNAARFSIRHDLLEVHNPARSRAGTRGRTSARARVRRCVVRGKQRAARFRGRGSELRRESRDVELHRGTAALSFAESL